MLGGNIPGEAAAQPGAETSLAKCHGHQRSRMVPMSVSASGPLSPLSAQAPAMPSLKSVGWGLAWKGLFYQKLS